MGRIIVCTVTILTALAYVVKKAFIDYYASAISQ